MIKKIKQTNKNTKKKQTNKQTKTKTKTEKQNKNKNKNKKRTRSTDLRLTALFFTLQQPSSFKMTAVEMASRTVFPPGP